MWNFIREQLLEKLLGWLFGGSTTKKGEDRTEVIGSSQRSPYFQLLEENKSAKENGNYKKAVSYALEAIPHFKEVEGKEDIQVIWPIVEVSKFLPMFREGKAELERVKEIVKSNPDFGENWAKEIDHAIEVAEILHKIIEFLRENPGFPQSDLWKEFDVDGRKWASRMETAEKVGVIKRERNGEIKLYANGKVSFKR